MPDHSPTKAETDFRDLLREPEKMFGYTYLYFLMAIVVLGILYVWSLTTVGKNSVAPSAPADSSMLIQDIPFVAPSVLPPVDVVKAGITSDSAIARGRDLFRANCSACHGDNGQGDGPTAPTLNPRPRNFHSLQGWKNGSKVSQMYKTLQEGIPGSGMASYAYMSPADRFALIHFVRSFAPGQPADLPGDLQQLEALYQLSKGVNRPAQIPIIRAQRLVIAENAAVSGTALRVRVALDADTVSKGAAILKALAGDEQRAIAALVLRARPFAGTEDFLRCVSANPLAVGLRASVNELDSERWKTLHQEVEALRKAVQ